MAKKRVHRPDGYPASPSAANPVGPGPRGPRKADPRAATPTKGPARARFEAFSTPILLRMQLLPGFLIPVLLGVLLFVGLVVPSNWAGLALVFIAVFLAWLTAVSWPAISPGSRALRVLVNIALLALGVAKLLGRFG